MNKRVEQATPVLAVDGRWRLSGALTMDSAAQVLAASRGIPLPPSGVISLGGVDRVDSAGVAVLLARSGARRGRQVAQLRGGPPNLDSLAALYGV